jgi:hypothetical protein
MFVAAIAANRAKPRRFCREQEDLAGKARGRRDAGKQRERKAELGARYGVQLPVGRTSMKSSFRLHAR